MSEYPKLIGIHGKAGSGKSWLGANVLAPLGYKQYALAWPFKHTVIGRCGGMFGAYESVMVHKPALIRDQLQREGTELGWMKYGRKLWCHTADAWMRTLEEEYGATRFYVPDVRFPHEVEWLRERGGKLIHIYRRGSGLTDAAAQHTSETALDDFDAYDARVNNDPLHDGNRSAVGVSLSLFYQGVLPLTDALRRTLSPAACPQLELDLH